MGDSLDMALADGHALFVGALATVLEQHGHHVRLTATTRSALVEGISALRPAVCLMGNHFPDGEGIDVIARISRASPITKIIVLTADTDSQTLRRALAAGASGYVHKSRGVQVLLDALSRVAAGEVVVEAAVSAPRPVETAEQHDLARLAAYLTHRELECLDLLVAGLDTTAIARRLGVRQTTVRTHVQSVLNKLGVHSRLEAASLATRFGLVGVLPSRPAATGTDGPATRVPGGSG